MTDKIRWPRDKRAVWGVAPPLLAAPFWKRLKIVSDQPEVLVVLSHSMEETKTHFVDGRTQPCTGEHGQCWCSHIDHGAGRYEGWLAVWSAKWNDVFIVSLTKVAVAQEPRLRLPDYDLRGLTLCVARKKAFSRAPMQAWIRGDARHTGHLLAAPDLKVLVERLWSAEDRFDPRRGAKRTSLFETSSAAANGMREGATHG